MSFSTISKILGMKSVAIVGVSKKPSRPSYQIFQYLRKNNYHTFLVNPNYSIIDKKECYKKLEAIKSDIDVVNIFRKSEHVLPIIKSSIRIKAKAIWMQDEVRNDEAHNLARNNGLLVVMNDCILRQHKKTQSHF